MKLLDKRSVQVTTGSGAERAVEVEVFESEAGSLPARVVRATCEGQVVERSWTLRPNETAQEIKPEKIGLRPDAGYQETLVEQLQRELDRMREEVAAEAARRYDVAEAAKQLK